MRLVELQTKDGQIMKLRALGYSQIEIAKRLGITQPAVSQRIHSIRKKAVKCRNDDKAFWELLLGLGTAYLLLKLFEEGGKGR